jgi:hypothetical protein
MECIDDWLFKNQNCPICRKELNVDELKKSKLEKDTHNQGDNEQKK